MSCLKQQTFIISQFLRFRNLSAAWLAASASGSLLWLSLMELLAGPAVSSQSSTERGSTSKLTQVVVGRIRLLTGGWTEDICQRPHFLATRASP